MIFGPDTDAPLEPPPETLDEVRPVRLQTVLGGTPQSQQWNAFIARYRVYLGYKLPGQHRSATSCMTATVGSWPCSGSPPRHANLPRDRFFGWTPTLRDPANLPKVMTTTRFLILPWIRASSQPRQRTILSATPCRRQLIEDWTARYHITPLLIETFVASTPTLHWRHLQGALDGPMLASPQGRGRYATRHKKARQAEKNHLARGPCRQGLETDARNH